LEIEPMTLSTRNFEIMSRERGVRVPGSAELRLDVRTEELWTPVKIR